MKLKTLAAMCKSEQMYYLYDRVNEGGEIIEQWLGTGAALFPLSGLPLLTEDNLISLFDITEKQQEKAIIMEKTLPATFNFDDSESGEIMLDREKLTIGYNGRVIRPIFTSGGIEFIDTKYLAPLADVADDLELFERTTAGGGVYFAAKLGLMIVGVIMPLNIIDSALVNYLEGITRECQHALDFKKDLENKNGSSAEYQMNLAGEETK